MTNLELVLNMLAEASTTEISKEKQPVTLAENTKVARQRRLRCCRCTEKVGIRIRQKSSFQTQRKKSQIN
jgi:hypothetical protein